MDNKIQTVRVITRMKIIQEGLFPVKKKIQIHLTMQDMTADRITAEAEVIHLKIISRIIVTVKITVRTIVIWIAAKMKVRAITKIMEIMEIMEKERPKTMGRACVAKANRILLPIQGIRRQMRTDVNQNHPNPV